MAAFRGSVLAWATVGVVLLLGTLALTSFVGLGSAAAVPTKVKTPYTVTFNETGLPSGTSWSVHVAYVGCGCQGVRKTVSSTTPTITIPVTNGTYNYKVERVTGYFVNVTPSGSFNVTGANVSGISFTFNPVVPFVVEFNETGLPHSTLWSVSLKGNGKGQEKAVEDQTASSYGTSLNFTLPNGTYRYTVANVPGSFFVNHSSTGKFVVAGASLPAIEVKFTTPPLYAVTFNESGLPAGTNWSVRAYGFGGVKINEVLSSTNASLTFHLPNGSYTYVIAQVLAFNIASPLSGHFDLSGANASFNVSFVPVAPGAFYAVGFEESGLAVGTHWAVTVTITHTFGHSRKTTQSGTGSTIFLLLPNSTYKFQVHKVRGYDLTAGATGEFTIAGSSPSVELVTYTAIPTYSATFNETGLANGTTWTLLLHSQTRTSSPWYIHVTLASTTSSIAFALPNGTYCYKVYAVSGYKLTSGVAAGTFTVSGAAPSTVTFGFTAKG